MKIHTSDFKSKIKEMGRELDSKITYIVGSEEVELGLEDLNSITPHYQGTILKSVMKQLDIDSNEDIPLGTEINYQFGIKINDTYEYLDYGNYIVYSSEKQEDTRSYKIVAYDKMLYSMKDYETPKEYVLTEDEEFIDDKTYYELIDDEYLTYTGTTTGDPSQLGLYEYDLITYPITIRSYLNAICNCLGLVFKNSNDTFTNYNKIIQNELYIDNNGNSLGYTFRDVLDQLSQVTASTICLDKNDNLEIRYINDTEDIVDEEFLKDINVNFGEKYGPINTVSFKRSAESDVISKSIPIDLPDDEKIEIAISDNQILNGNNRDEFIDDILNKLYGLEYYVNDYSSTGICYLDLCDRYSVEIDNKNYSCIMFNDEADITQGLEEKVHTERPEDSVTDYKKASTTDRKINQAYIIVDKVNNEITALTSETQALSTQMNNNYQELLQSVQELDSSIIDLDTRTTQVEQTQTDSYTKTEIREIITGTNSDGVSVTSLKSTSATFDENGMHYAKTGAETSSTINESGLEVDDNSGTELLFAGYDRQLLQALVRVANLYLTRYLGFENWRVEEIEDNDLGIGLGFFYTGGE